MANRKFGVTLLSTPDWYIFSEEEIKGVYYNLIKFIRNKYKDSDYDYCILVGISNVDGKSVGRKKVKNCIGRPTYTFIAKDENKEIKYVNWHLHIMVCGAPLGTMVKDIGDYLQKILNKKLFNEEFDKEVYNTKNFIRNYTRSYKNEHDLLLSGLLRKRKSKKERVPKCCLSNLNVNRRKTSNSKEDFFNIMEYIKKQSTLDQIIESKDFLVGYFDIAKKMNLLAKIGTPFKYKRRKNKE